MRPPVPSYLSESSIVISPRAILKSVLHVYFYNVLALFFASTYKISIIKKNTVEKSSKHLTLRIDLRNVGCRRYVGLVLHIYRKNKRHELISKRFDSQQQGPGPQLFSLTVINSELLFNVSPLLFLLLCLFKFYIFQFYSFSELHTSSSYIVGMADHKTQGQK